MKLLELYQKFQKSGFEGNPIISTKELKELKEKLEEMYEFFSVLNPFKVSIVTDIESIDRIISARKSRDY